MVDFDLPTEPGTTTPYLRGYLAARSRWYSEYLNTGVRYWLEIPYDRMREAHDERIGRLFGVTRDSHGTIRLELSRKDVDFLADICGVHSSKGLIATCSIGNKPRLSYYMLGMVDGTAVLYDDEPEPCLGFRFQSERQEYYFTHFLTKRLHYELPLHEERRGNVAVLIKGHQEIHQLCLHLPRYCGRRDPGLWHAIETILNGERAA